MERTFFHALTESLTPPCITRLHVEKGAKHKEWHIVVFCGDSCAGVLSVPEECGQPLVDLLLPEDKRIEGGTRETDQG